MRRSTLFLAGFSLLGLVGCSAEGGESPVPVGSRSAPIYGGTLDSNPEQFPATVALLQLDTQGNVIGACSGTVVSVKGGNGVVLTAGHCVAEYDAQGNVKAPPVALPPSRVLIVSGTDYANPKAIYSVSQLSMHPAYDPGGSGLYDFAMVRFSGAPGGMPSVPPLTSAEDKLNIGSVLDVVGYGKTQNNDQNSLRFRLKDTINEIYPVLLGFSQTQGGVCQGDSGGPSFATLNGQLRVAGVSSFITGQCGTGSWYAGRVSAVNSSFVQPFIDGTPAQLTCDECRQASTNVGGACRPAVDACLNNAACNNLLGCLNSCSDDACVQNCATQYQSGVDPYLAIFDCQCTTACQSECAADPSCQGQTPPACGLDYQDAATCNTCINEQCCGLEQACADDPSCINCLTDNPPAGCDTNVKLADYQQCYLSKCSVPCGIQGNKCGLASGDVTCNTCIESTCCQQAADCFNNATCFKCISGVTTGAACSNNAAYNSFVSCYSQDCGVACGVSGAGGAAGSGGSGQAGTGQAGSGQAGTGVSGAGGSGAGQGGTGQAGTGACSCTGTNNLGQSVTVGCGEVVCGSDNFLYTCTNSGGFAGPGAPCGGGEGGSGGSGQSGAGGDPAGGSGGSGQAGSGQGGTGEAGSGQAGSGEGGTGEAGSGQAGTGEAGAGGTGEAGSGQGGTATAGKGGSGGKGGSAGKGGSGGSGQGGAAAGTAGAAGVSAAGTAGASAAGTAGATGAAVNGAAPAADEGGCGCGVVGQTSPQGAGQLALAALGLVASRLRRRRVA